jgi:hypothetical protein
VYIYYIHSSPVHTQFTSAYTSTTYTVHKCIQLHTTYTVHRCIQLHTAYNFIAQHGRCQSHPHICTHAHMHTCIYALQHMHICISAHLHTCIPAYLPQRISVIPAGPQGCDRLLGPICHMPYAICHKPYAISWICVGQWAQHAAVS